MRAMQPGVPQRWHSVGDGWSGNEDQDRLPETSGRGPSEWTYCRSFVQAFGQFAAQVSPRQSPSATPTKCSLGEAFCIESPYPSGRTQSQLVIIHAMPLERRIYFYRANISYFDSVKDGTKEKPSDLSCLFQEISKLTWDVNATASAYLADGDGSIAVRIVKRQGRYVLGQLAKIRKDGLPPVEKGGVVQPLQLSADEGLYEAAHFGLFWDQQVPILAIEFNPYAPRQARLGEYLIEKLKHNPVARVDSCHFSPYVRGDVYDQFMAAGDLAELQLNVLRDTAINMKSALKNNKLGDALAAQAEATTEMETVGIYVHRGLYKRSGGAGRAWKRQVLELIKACKGGLVRAKAMVEPDATGKGRLQALDLLADKWVHVIQVPKTQNRMIDSPAFLDQIHTAYSGIALDLIRDGASSATTT